MSRIKYSKPSIANIKQYRAKYQQWQFAAEVVRRLREEQGNGELNFNKLPEVITANAPRVLDLPIPVHRTKDRTGS